MAYKELQIRLEFTTPCLGNERNDDPEPNRMMRDTGGSVIFLQSWWRACIGEAADIYGKHQKRVSDIRWNPCVDGTIELHKRFYYKQGIKYFKEHESFLQGAVIGVKALVPDDVPVEDFHEIMSLAGTYRGISPFGWRHGYGKFIVREVTQTYGRGGSITEGQGKHDGCVSDNSATDGDTGDGT